MIRQKFDACLEAIGGIRNLSELCSFKGGELRLCLEDVPYCPHHIHSITCYVGFQSSRNASNGQWWAESHGSSAYGCRKYTGQCEDKH